MVHVIQELGDYLEPEELTTIFEHTNSEEMRLIFKICYYCGRRVSEVLALQTQNINIKHKEIIFLILKKKNRTQNILPLPEFLYTEILTYISNKNLKSEQKLFTVSRQAVWKAIKTIANKSGIHKPNMRVHILRHSFGVNWVRNGGDITRLQKILAHNDLRTTQVYLQFARKDISEEYLRIVKQ